MESGRASIEIERKFLVANETWRAAAGPAVRYRQGYLSKTALGTVRVRVSDGGAYVTIKGRRRGLTRRELSYAVPIGEAEELLALCGRWMLEKERHLVEHRGSIWEVDVYLGAAAGLVVAEIELEREDQLFAIPPWLGQEVSLDRRYRNSSIALQSEPYVTGESSRAAALQAGACLTAGRAAAI
jgi:adenylate cyclase